VLTANDEALAVLSHCQIALANAFGACGSVLQVSAFSMQNECTGLR
jgi:hypothetical protein